MLPIDTCCIKSLSIRISESLDSNRPSSFEDCISWARLQFQQRFHNEIAQVLPQILVYPFIMSCFL